jgi:hypothetical protein
LINPLPFVVAAVVVFLGLRFGQRGSAIAFRASLLAFAALVVWSRLEFSETESATSAMMWSGFVGMLLLFVTFAWIGPMAFKRWTYAMALSVGLVVGLGLLLQAAPWTPACVFFAKCNPAYRL